MSNLSPGDMAQRLDQAALQFEAMLREFLDAARVRLAATATREYMRDAAITSPPFPPRKSASGPLRILSGRLARSLTGASSFTGGGAAHPENISRIVSSEEEVRLEYGTNVPYAAAHEYGFRGIVYVRPHHRQITQAFGRAIAPTRVQVQGYAYRQNIPARPYLSPSLDDNLEILQQMLAKESTELILEATK